VLISIWKWASALGIVLFSLERQFICTSKDVDHSASFFFFFFGFFFL
jgi:hypothetical protein